MKSSLKLKKDTSSRHGCMRRCVWRYFSTIGCSTMDTTLHASGWPVEAHSFSMSSTVPCKALHRLHSQRQRTAQMSTSSRNIKPIATLDSLCKALAVSSIRLVSRSPHNSASKELADDADSCERAGTGSIELYKMG